MSCWNRCARPLLDLALQRSADAWVTLGRSKMSDFEQLLVDALKGSDGPGLLRNYLGKNTGGHFETFATCRSDPFNITGDDLVAVTMLSMEIKAKTSSGISPASALRVEQRQSTINALLTRLPVHAKLHELTQDEADALLLAHDSPAWTLWEELLEALKADNTADKRVAVSKLLARKRPNLIPMGDNNVLKALGRRNHNDWWPLWWSALHGNPTIVARLKQLRKAAGAPHLSLLRTADIILWMRSLPGSSAPGSSARGTRPGSSAPGSSARGTRPGSSARGTRPGPRKGPAD